MTKPGECSNTPRPLTATQLKGAGVAGWIIRAGAKALQPQSPRRKPPGRTARCTEAVAVKLVATAERLIMLGFPAKTAFDAVAVAGWQVFKRQGMSAPVGPDRIEQLHAESGHLVRGEGLFFPDLPPPGFTGKWPPPRRWMYTKASLARLNPRPELKARELALDLLRDKAAQSEDPDAPVLAPEHSAKWQALLAEAGLRRKK